MYQLSYYFLEIRLRISYLVLSLILTLLTSYYYQFEILYIIGRPFLDLDHKLILIDLTEAFYTILRISGIISFLIIFPFFVYHFWSFYIPSRYNFERKSINKFSVFFFFMLFIELLLLYFFIFPKICEFLLNFEIISSKNGLSTGDLFSKFIDINLESNSFLDSFLLEKKQINQFFIHDIYTELEHGFNDTKKIPAFLELTARLQSYVKLSTRFYFIMLTIFQIPFLVVILYYYNIIDCYILCKFRKFFLFSSLLISAFISPPDLISQCLVAIFLFFLYELLVIIGIFLETKK